MAFISPIPSQEEGVAYLNAVADRISCQLKIGGHSKGGNIAVYSSIKCRQSVQKRITHVFSHDGPGFRDEVFQCHEYLIIKDRINKILPQSSIIGMLLQNQEVKKWISKNSMPTLQRSSSAVSQFVTQGVTNSME